MLASTDDCKLMSEELKRLLQIYATMNSEKADGLFKITANEGTSVAPILLNIFDRISKSSKDLLNERILPQNGSISSLLKCLKAMESVKTKFELSKNYTNLMCVSFRVLESFDKVIKELDSSTIAVIRMKDQKHRLTKLANTPLKVFLEAHKRIDNSGNADKKEQAFYRRVASVAMCGGIPTHYLDIQEAFPFKSGHFDKACLRLSNFKVKKERLKFVKRKFDFLAQNRNDDEFSEASLRSIFWDPVVSGHFDKPNAPWKFCSEYFMQNVLKLSSIRRADIAVMSQKFDHPIGIFEIGEDDIKVGHEHKDFEKNVSSANISCLGLAEKLKACNMDPTLARTFGILIGGDKVQVIVCHPVIEDSQIYTCVSMNDHWFLDFAFNREKADLNCDGECCTKDIFHIIPRSIESRPSVDITTIAKLNFVEMEEDNAQPEVDPEDNYESMAQSIGINKHSAKKFSACMKAIKDYIKFLDELQPDTDESNERPDFVSPNLAIVAGSTSKGETPKKNKKRIDVFNKTVTMNNVTNSELNLYQSTLFMYNVFPMLLESHATGSDLNTVTFEKMLPFLGNGILGFGGKGACFNPEVVRQDSPEHLLLEASTFALHTLYGLHILHEVVGYVHSDLSPSNIMFSPKDGHWKLNDFGDSLPVGKSLKESRKSGSPNYTAPESLKTGIFTKEADVYALGKVLWESFYLQIMWMVTVECDCPDTQAHFESFGRITQSMINTTPSERPSVIESMRIFYGLIQEHKLEDFEIHGSGSIMNNVRILLDHQPSSAVTIPEDILVQEIASQNFNI